MPTFKMTWSPAPTADTYKVEWFKNGVSLGTPTNTVWTSETKDITTVANDTIQGQVTAVNESGESPVLDSNVITALTAPPPAVTNLVLVQL